MANSLTVAVAEIPALNRKRSGALPVSEIAALVALALDSEHLEFQGTDAPTIDQQTGAVICNVHFSTAFTLTQQGE